MFFLITYVDFLNCDFLIIDSIIYSFNNKFEKVFNLVESLTQVRDNRIDEILELKIIADEEAFKSKAKAYKNKRGFINYNKNVLNYSGDINFLNWIGLNFKLTLNSDSKLEFNEESTEALLIEYLCDKVVIDDYDKSKVKIRGKVKE